MRFVCRLTPWILGLLALAGWVTAAVFAILWERELHSEPGVPVLPITGSWMGRFQHGVVAADNGVCSEIGRYVQYIRHSAIQAFRHS